jgi:hypothetical protein
VQYNGNAAIKMIKTATIRTTDVIMQINMGFLDGPNERKLGVKYLRDNFTYMKCHMCNMLPEPEDLGQEAAIQRIAFKSLEIGEWTSLTPNPPVTYNMQLTVEIQHEAPLHFPTVAAVIEAIYRNGTSFPSTIEEDANYFLYPYHSIVADLDDGICIGNID